LAANVLRKYSRQLAKKLSGALGGEPHRMHRLSIVISKLPVQPKFVVPDRQVTLASVRDLTYPLTSGAHFYDADHRR